MRLDDLLTGLAINELPMEGDVAPGEARVDGYTRRGCANNVGPLILRWTDQDKA
jgi:hypothetical protein